MAAPRSPGYRLRTPAQTALLALCSSSQPTGYYRAGLRCQPGNAARSPVRRPPTRPRTPSGLQIIRRPDDSLLALLLGTAIGVMFTLSVAEMWIHNAMEHGWLGVTGAVLLGALLYQVRGGTACARNWLLFCGWLAWAAAVWHAGVGLCCRGCCVSQ